MNLTTKMAAAEAGVSKSFLEKLRLQRPDESPPFLRIGRRVLYPRAALANWLIERLSVGRGPQTESPAVNPCSANIRPHAGTRQQVVVARPISRDTSR